VLAPLVEGCLAESKVLALLEGTLSAAELTEVDAHIDRCADCRILVSSLVVQRGSRDTDAPFSPTLLAATVDSDTPADSSERPLEGPVVIDVGETLATRFTVLERVGKGGMGEVFRARDGSSGGDVAVKVNGANGPAENARFEREAELLLRLDHPAIVQHVAHGRAEDGTPFLAMQWLEGEDLSSRLRRGRLPLSETMQIGIRIASALAAAHALGVVHRDIKPSNIFLSGGRCDGAMLIDFGVARSPWRGPASLSTRAGALLGTLGYMAPEQAVGAKTVDGRADVFSLGCVLFECLTGERLFQGEHAVEILAKLLSLPIRAPSDVVRDVPPALNALVARMLSRDVARRPASCTALVVELEEIVATGGRAVRAPPHRPASLPRAWIWGAAAVLLASTLLLAPLVTGKLASSRADSPAAVAPVVTAAPALPPLTSVAEVTSVTSAAPSAPPPAPSLEPSASAAPLAVPKARASPRPRPAPSARAPRPLDPREADPFGHFRN
jgi:hypothetical protein